jgi:hypothetical protein
VLLNSLTSSACDLHPKHVEYLKPKEISGTMCDSLIEHWTNTYRLLRI